MRARAIKFAILGCSLPVLAVAQPGPGPISTVVTSPNVTGQLQLIVTCSAQVSLTTIGLPDGWRSKSTTQFSFPFFNRSMTAGSALSFPRMNCAYGLGSDSVDIQAAGPPGFQVCKVDPTSNDKFICAASDAMSNFVKTFVP
jgi:hypothetical protein